ncbi:MAG TPA: plasmid pRiA4b ORF-3 family protein, partial [Chloroflexota bacterium]
MTSTARDAVRAALRQSGPLSLDDLVAHLVAGRALASKNPVQTVRNALANDPLCQRTADGRYGYVPALLRGASVRVVMDPVVPGKGLLALGVEAFALLWPTAAAWETADPAPTLALDGGPEVVLEGQHRGWGTGTRIVARFPAPFWSWWETRPGADALHLRCEDGQAGRYAAAAVRTAELDAAAVAASNDRLRASATEVLTRSRGLRADDLAWRLLAWGAYHGDPPPDPLGAVLSEPPGPFSGDGGLIVYRPELTTAVRRLFADRLAFDAALDDLLIRDLMGLPRPPAPEAGPPPASRPSRPSTARGHRLKVSLQWRPGVWRAIEILGSQTLEDLHDAIQKAFGWDDDHLYAFYLSGRPHDPLTAINRPYDGAEPPTADQVTVAELELRPGQRFLYIFDFGDDLRHEIELLGAFDAPGAGDFPRIVEAHGKAPRSMSSASPISSYSASISRRTSSVTKATWPVSRSRKELASRLALSSA